MENYGVSSEAVEEAFVGSFFLDNKLAQECSVKPEQVASNISLGLSILGSSFY
jgi:hypothetical protein